MLANSTDSKSAGHTTAGSGLMVFVTNTGIAACDVTVDIGAAAPHASIAWVTRIDANNSNPLGAWQRQGSPPFPSLQELAMLNTASQLVTRRTPLTNQAITLTVPAAGLAVIAL